MVKQCGIAPIVVMRTIFILIFTGRNLFRYLQADASTVRSARTPFIAFSIRSVPTNANFFICSALPFSIK